MWFDTHCHLDAQEFDHDRAQVIDRAKQAGLSGVLVPAVAAKDFEILPSKVDGYAIELPHACFTLGIHPLYTLDAKESDILSLEKVIQRELNNPRFVGVGEIGLDYFVDYLDNAKQEWFFEEQLKLANRYELPVILHVRRSQDQILKRLRQFKLTGGIAHAFNGSMVQANEFLKFNMKLGFGGAMTYDRALQIRRLAKELPLESFLLETDSPDIPPAWLTDKSDRRNEPSHLVGIAEVMATLRGVSKEEVSRQVERSLLEVIPRLTQLIKKI